MKSLFIFAYGVLITLSVVQSKEQYDNKSECLKSYYKGSNDAFDTIFSLLENRKMYDTSEQAIIVYKKTNWYRFPGLTVKTKK